MNFKLLLHFERLDYLDDVFTGADNMGAHDQIVIIDSIYSLVTIRNVYP